MCSVKSKDEFFSVVLHGNSMSLKKKLLTRQLCITVSSKSAFVLFWARNVKTAQNCMYLITSKFRQLLRYYI